MGRVAEISIRPCVVCLCGSTRFADVFQAINLQETLAGRIVLSIGCNTKSDEGLGLSLEDKKRLDMLHLRKIDLADEIVVINLEGYVGESTSYEIEYAARHGKRIRWLVVPAMEARYELPLEGSACCEYTGCVEVAPWVCRDGRGNEWCFCCVHVFQFGYVAEETIWELSQQSHANWHMYGKFA